MLIDRQRDLSGAVGGPDPGALDPHAPAPEGDLTGPVAVAHGRAIRVVATLWADDLGDLFFHRLGQDAQADSHRAGLQALLNDSDKLPEHLLDA